MAGFDDDDFNFSLDEVDNDDFNISKGTDDGFSDAFDDVFNSSASSGSSEYSDDTESDFGDFGGNGGNGSIQMATEDTSGKKALIKQAVIIAVVGLILVIVAFGVVKWLTGGKEKPKETDTNIPSISQNIPQSSNNASNSKDAWIKFNGAEDISFKEEYIQSIFTVTSIDKYVKIVDVENNLMIKAVLIGTLSGFVGTYELEVPYSIANQLSTGNSFKVEVQVGESSGKRVIGDIKY